MHLRAEEAHPLDVGLLPPHVFLAHVDDALETEARTHCRGRDAVLAGAGLGDDAVLPESLGEHDLAERVVQLVRARVQQVLALQVDALAGCEALAQRERRRPAGVRGEQPVQLGVERVVCEGLTPAALELVERRDQRLGDVAAAVRAERARAHCRASSMYARTRAWSLMPGSVSSDDAASTAHGCTAAIAART